eukprot:14914930-Alexandrium_andersonii.AAC.1
MRGPGRSAAALDRAAGPRTSTLNLPAQIPPSPPVHNSTDISPPSPSTSPSKSGVRREPAG